MKKILIVEDDRFLLGAYRAKLEKSDFEVKTASDGQEALDSLKTSSPDLILLDLVMPIKDGFTTLQEIRAMAKFKKTPIIIASNLGQKEDIDKGMSLGATGYIVKSDISLDDLIVKIKKLL
jgi:two-component system, OmpR family, alkaline phosphatase synthesis response regulator PhoP